MGCRGGRSLWEQKQGLGKDRYTASVGKKKNLRGYLQKASYIKTERIGEVGL